MLEELLKIKAQEDKKKEAAVILLCTGRAQFPLRIFSLSFSSQQTPTSAPKMKTFFPKFAIKQYSTYVAMIVIFVHNYVLDEDLNCTCDADITTCSFYLVLPFLILFSLQLWTDEPFKRVWKYTCPTCTCCCCCCKCRCKLFLVLCLQIMKAVCIGLLWVLSVFIDGDWFVCCCNTYKEHPQLGCKDKENITAEERVLIAKLKNKSMVSKVVVLHTSYSTTLCCSLDLLCFFTPLSTIKLNICRYREFVISLFHLNFRSLSLIILVNYKYKWMVWMVTSDLEESSYQYRKTLHQRAAETIQCLEQNNQMLICFHVTLHTTLNELFSV